MRGVLDALDIVVLTNGTDHVIDEAHAKARDVRQVTVRADNPRAVALSRSLGIQEEGSRRGLIRRDDGNFVDDIGMGLLLPDPDEPSASS